MNERQQEIMEYLNARKGEYMTPIMIGKGTHIPLTNLRKELADMAGKGKIRRAGTHSALTFYIPSEAQLAAEQKLLATVVRKPLAPRPLIAERIAQIRAERELYPSIC